MYSHLLFLCGLWFPPRCCVTSGREGKPVCRCAGAERWMDGLCTLAVIKTGAGGASRCGILVFHRTSVHTRAQMRWLRFPVTVAFGLFGQWLNSRHIFFSSPASDSFPKGQLEVQSSHTVCVLDVRFRWNCGPSTSSPSLLQSPLLKTWTYCLFPCEPYIFAIISLSVVVPFDIIVLSSAVRCECFFRKSDFAERWMPVASIALFLHSGCVALFHWWSFLSGQQQLRFVWGFVSIAITSQHTFWMKPEESSQI